MSAPAWYKMALDAGAVSVEDGRHGVYAVTRARVRRLNNTPEDGSIALVYHGQTIDTTPDPVDAVGWLLNGPDWAGE